MLISNAHNPQPPSLVSFPAFFFLAFTPPDRYVGPGLLFVCAHDNLNFKWTRTLLYSLLQPYAQIRAWHSALARKRKEEREGEKEGERGEGKNGRRRWERREGENREARVTMPVSPFILPAGEVAISTCPLISFCTHRVSLRLTGQTKGLKLKSCRGQNATGVVGTVVNRATLPCGRMALTLPELLFFLENLDS